MEVRPGYYVARLTKGARSNQLEIVEVDQTKRVYRCGVQMGYSVHDFEFKAPALNLEELLLR